jgi:hypothetical protein
MNFDLRLPLGLIFSLFGGIIAVDGALSDPRSYAMSLGINVNLGWGLVMLAFGAAMLGLALRARRAKGSGPKSLIPKIKDSGPDPLA